MSVEFDGFEAAPPRAGLAVTLVPAVLAVVVVATSPLALLASGFGAVVVLGGVRAGSRRLVTAGTVAVFGGAILAGVQGGSIAQVTVGAAAAVVAWDAGTNAIAIGRQLGARADTARVLVAHSLATAAVAALIGIGAVATYWLSRGGEPTAAVALLLLAALTFILLLDR